MTKAQMRLQAVTERLKAAGVLDVKFTLAPNSNPFRDTDRVADDLAALLEAHLEGRSTTVALIGDSQFPKRES